MRRFAGLATVALVALTACQDATRAPLDRTDQPTFGAEAASAAAGQYIVVFHDGVADAPGLARRLTLQGGGTLHFTYEHALRGFAAALPDQAVEGLRRNPNVAYIEADASVRLFDTQTNPPWGLDRVDQRSLPLSGGYTYTTDGTGVNVYIFDTGVRRTHNDFGGRVQYVPNGANGDFVGDGHGSAEDCHGHGTHVAGSAAGSTYGMAKGAAIWAARVVNCSGGGNVSMAIAAVDWATANAQRPAVVNMSLGYGNVQSLRDAVENSIAAGVNYAVAAGNGNFAGIPQDACSESPAGAPNALTVGASASDDTEGSFSNYGPCVDLLAPGVAVTSDYYASNSATATMSGTSMATPHVTGAVALYLAATPGATPAQVAQALTGNATQDALRLHRRSRQNGTPNLLLYTGFIGGGDPPPPPPPSGFTLSATGYKVRGVQHADLSWSGSGATSFAVRRDGTIIATVGSSGYTDNIGNKGGGSYQYQVCEAGTSTCSNTVTVAF